MEALKQLPERTGFMKGLFAWIGFPSVEIAYDREPRHAGNTKWNYRRPWNLALDGTSSITATPLKVSPYTGALITLCASLHGFFALAVGIIGEYLGRMFVEVKPRARTC